MPPMSLFRSVSHIRSPVKQQYRTREILPQIRRRAMASIASSQREWLVIVPDHQDKLDKRIEIRATHLQRVSPQVEKDMIRMGGATLGAPLEEGKPPQMTGSAFVIRAETEQEVRAFLENDIYAKEGVWNLEKTSIIPFRTAVRSPN